MGCGGTKSTAVQEVSQPGKAPKSSSSASKPSGKNVAGPAVSADIIAKKVAQGKNTGVLPLRECGLKIIPDAATGAGMEKLRTVDISINVIKALPDGIGSWTGLQNLVCANNALETLPASIGMLTKLQKLDLSENKLRALPKELGGLCSLKVLTLNCNSLGPKIPDDIFYAGALEALQDLDLSSNALKELPACLGNQQALLRLTVCKNELTMLPDSLGGLSKLQYLDAASNQLTAVPPAILSDTALSELWLKGNPIDRLALQEVSGFSAFLERRKLRLDAKIDSHVVGAIDLAVCGLD
jgi:Leucine-rich repeat (LRR) protein